MKALSLRKYTREFKYNLTLAYPVVVGLLGHTFVQLIDNIMVGQLGTAELAAISLGNSFIFVAMAVGIGFSTAITPLIAEADGANDIRTGRSVFIHGFLLCSFLGVFLAVAILASKPLLFRMGQPPEVVKLAYPYLQWVAISLVPLITFQSFKQFLEGLSHTRPAMYAMLLGNLINVTLNYFLIFGHWIFPKMGIEGAAIGTMFARLGTLIFIVVYVWFDKQFVYYTHNIKLKLLEIDLLRKIMSLGFPSALQVFFEVLFFTATVWLSGMLGKNSQAANQIALSLSSITFMFAMGLNATAMIRVGNQKGKKNFEELKRIAFSIFLLMFIFDLIFCSFFLVTHDYLPWIYLDEKDVLSIADVKEVVKLASGLLVVAGFFQIFDGLQTVVLGALRGAQDVNIPTWITFFAYWLIGFPTAYYLGTYGDLGVYGIWVGLLIGLTVSAAMLMLRFKKFINKLLVQNTI